MNTEAVIFRRMQDFRLYLQNELANRCRKNPQYSLRAFAKSLRMDHATLSQIMRGKRALSDGMQKRIASALGLGPEEMRRFQKTNAELKKFLQLEIDTFAVISDWYHDAILELTRFKFFRSDHQWIAKVLGVTVNEVNIAVERLQRLNLLKITKSGQWKDLSPDNTINHVGDYTNTALRKYQKQIFQMAQDAVDNVSRTERDHTSVMMTLDKNDIPKAKEMIRDFRIQMANYFQRKNVRPNELYSLAIALFPITQINQSGEIE